MGKQSRRDFFKNSSAAGAATYTAFNSFLFHLCASLPKMVSAQEMNSSMNYLCFVAESGPARRLFDLPLKHNGSTINVGPANANRITNYSDVSKFHTTYESFDYKGLSLPYLNRAKIPTVDGGTANMSDLFANALLIRGIDLGNPGHEQCLEMIARPSRSASSLLGLVAENSNSTFPSVDLDTFLSYSSLKGVSQIKGARQNTMSSILQHFNNNYSGANSYKKVDVENKIDSILNLFRDRYAKTHPNISKLYADRVTAKNVLKSNLGAYLDQFDAILAKYDTLLSDAIRSPSLAGVFDPLPTRNADQTTSTSPLFKWASSGIIQNNYLQEIIAPSSKFDRYAQSLALAEILLTENLSSSISCEVGQINRLHTSFNGTTISESYNTHDLHGIGGYAILFLESLFFYGFATGLNELISKLKDTPFEGGNVYDNTLIQLASEFPGRVENDGNDMQHMFDGQNTSLFSGKFKNPLLVGNIRRDTYTHGRGAPVEALGGRYMNNGNLATTITEILGVPTPTPNDQSVASVDEAGNLTSKIGPAKIIG